jgi:hypothetical protein
MGAKGDRKLRWQALLNEWHDGVVCSCVINLLCTQVAIDHNTTGHQPNVVYMSLDDSSCLTETYSQRQPLPLSIV